MKCAWSKTTYCKSQKRSVWKNPAIVGKSHATHDISSLGMKTLTLVEAADFLKLHPEELRRRAKSGRVPGAKAGKC